MTTRAESENLGLGEFTWFVGVVASLADPLHIGRVRVRCHNWHESAEIPDDALPFAQVITPITNAARQNTGTTALGMVVGTTVFGFFLDGRQAQHPVILGTLVGVTDNVPDMHELARPKTLTGTPAIIGKRNAFRVQGVPTARGGSWSEPEAGWDALKTLYPYNIVYANGNGYVKEIDGTPDNSRVAEYTADGGYTEVKQNGDRILRVTNDNYTIVAGSDFVSILGDANLTVSGALRIKAESLNIETGSYTLKVAGESLVEHAGDMSITYGAKRSTYQKGDTLSRHDAGTDFTCPSDPPRIGANDCSDVSTP